MIKQNFTEEKLSLEEFQAFRFQPIVPVNDLKDIEGNSLADSFPYWRRHNLMPFIPKGAWNVEISFSQLIWLRILDNLRMFSYKINDTQKICDYLFKDAYFADLPTKNLLQRKDFLKKKEVTGTLDENDRQILIELDRILNDPLLLYGLKFEINYLTNLVSWCIDFGEEAGLLVFSNGNVAEKRGDKISTHLNEPVDADAPHIYFSIRYFLQEFIENEVLESIITPYLLNENEKIVLKELRNKNVKELRIVINEKKVIRIDSQEQKLLTEDKSKEIRRILGLHNYEEVTISTRDEKQLHFKKTKKKILSD